MADQSKDPAAEWTDPVVKTDDKSATLPPSNPPAYRELAAALPEKDDVQKAYKEAMTATDHGKEAKAKAKVVDASPDADETPSGAALKKVAGVSHDTERGEKYAREKTARRWGYVPVND